MPAAPCPRRMPPRHRQRGHVALIFAGAGCFLAAIGGAAIHTASVVHTRADLQGAVDAAALAAAKELGVQGLSKSGIEDRATGFARAQLEEAGMRESTRLEAQIIDQATAVTVTARATVDAILPGLTPATAVEVHATAENVQKTPLCILLDQGHWGVKLDMFDASSLRAPGCLLQVNGNITIDSSSTLLGAAIKATGTSTAGTWPLAETGALRVPDPFERSLPGPEETSADCPVGGDPRDWVQVASGTLEPGLHCKAILVPAGQTLRLMPGEHVFASNLLLEDNARLEGQDVVSIFVGADNSPIRLKDSSVIALEGRRSGPFAGFVIHFANKGMRYSQRLRATGIKNLTGVVYMPRGILDITAEGDVAEASDWTVIVAERLILRNKARLVINKNYLGSDVPVPDGVGNWQDGVRLRR